MTRPRADQAAIRRVRALLALPDDRPDTEIRELPHYRLARAVADLDAALVRYVVTVLKLIPKDD